MTGTALAQTDPAPELMPETAATSAPGNTAPEHDARGIPVVSDPAEVPAGFNSPPGMNAAPSAAYLALQPATGDYPACSRTVTDNCMQTYEWTRKRRNGASHASDPPICPDRSNPLCRQD
ncbi:MAG TPA: hypothetical protein VEW71_04465 [Allosphingosinicella sp.]|nr:hypothetical protein [Allosphingosinicella sp.]